MQSTEVEFETPSTATSSTTETRFTSLENDMASIKDGQNLMMRHLEFLKGQDNNAKSPAPCLVSKNNSSSLERHSTGTTLSNTFSGHDTSETGKTETPSTSKFP